MKTKSHLLTDALIGLLFGASGLLRADTPPKIIDPPLTQFAWVGRPVTLQVSFTNKTAMAYQWQWNGTNLPDATNKTHRLSSAQLTNNGDYQVILSNSGGVVTSAVAHLTVRDWPEPTGVSFTDVTTLETGLKNVILQHDVPGASLAIMKDGRLILARGYGYADPEINEPVQPDSLFRIASLTKAITATAILKMVDEGRIDLDVPVFPALQLPQPAFVGAKADPRLTNITVRQCLNHTAGWNRDIARNPTGGTGFDPALWFRRCAFDLGITNRLTDADLVEWITGFPLQYKPGSTFSYSNNGYTVAGVLLERLTGLSYEQLIRSMLSSLDITRIRIPGTTREERVLDEVVQWLSPLFDLRSVPYYELPASITSETAYGYSKLVWAGAAGCETSTIDYARFIGAIDGKPVPPDMLATNALKTMLTVTPQSRAGGEPYGMGWDIDEATGELYHGGIDVATTTRIVRLPNGVVAAVFCSTRDESGLFDLLKTTLDGALAGNKSWPTNDLFAATTSYEAWQSHHFMPAELSQPDISGDDADPDGDGISNLIEYAQGSDPRTSDHEPWLKGSLVGDRGQSRFALEYRRRPLGHAVAYDIEVSNDLNVWRSWDPVTTTEKLNPDGFVSTSLMDDPINTSAVMRFYRVRIRPSHPKL